MLKSKRSTRPSESRRHWTLLSADEKVRLNLDIPKQRRRGRKKTRLRSSAWLDCVKL